MQAKPASASIPDLTGQWRVVHRVRRSNLQRYVGLTIEFQVNLVEFGGAIVGNGEKFLVDSELTSPDAVSRLEISGVIEGSDIRLFLMERPEGRPDRMIVGEIVWCPVDIDHMTGTFWVDLQRTSGRSEAFRWSRGKDADRPPPAAVALRQPEFLPLAGCCSADRGSRRE